MSKIRGCGLILSLSLSFHLGEAADVIVVAQTAGPGVDFTDLQAAIDAAQDGDVVLVKAYHGLGATIDGKALHVIAETVGDVTVGGQGLEIRNLLSTQSVVVRGIVCVMPTQNATLRINSCAGSVWIEDCKFLRIPQGGTPPVGARIVDSKQVVIIRCTVEGGTNTLVPCLGVAGRAALEVLGTTTRLALHEVILTGGNATSGCSLASGMNGGAALVFNGESLYVAGSQLIGGDASHGGCPFSSCPGGNGGDCVVCKNPSTNEVWAWDNIYKPGKKGLGFQGPDGASGSIFVDPLGVVSTTLRPARFFVAGSPSVATHEFIATVEGNPNDMVWMWVDSKPALTPTDLQIGLLHTTQLAPVIALGTIGTGGFAQFPLSIPPLPTTAGLALTGYAQTAILGGGELTLSSPSAFVVLDPSL